jgi:hypothetical protein
LRPYDFVRPAYIAQAKPSWKRLTRQIDFSHPDRDELALRHAIERSEGLPRRVASVKARRRPAVAVVRR